MFYLKLNGYLCNPIPTINNLIYMNIRYLGHSTFEVEYNGKNLLVDPYIRKNELAKNIDIGALTPDYILLTHGHSDHVMDAEEIALRSKATIISNFEIVSWYENKGISGHPLNHGGSNQFDFGKIKYVSAIHSSVLPDGTYGGNPGGFVLSGGEVVLYIAGDTALTMDMKLIPMLGPAPDVCIFPIGDNFTMGIDDAIIAADFVQCDTIIGCHYDTFGYIKINHEKAQKAFSIKGKKLLLPKIGEQITF